MNEQDLKYCLAKQLSTAHTVQTDYGDFVLDHEMKKALEKALRPIIEKRLKK